MSQFFEVHPENPQLRLLKQAVQLLEKGGVLAVPTDSSYALVCHLDDKAAADNLRRIRGVDDKHHLTLLCRDLAELASSAGLGLDAVRAVERGQRLAAIELHQHLGLRGPIRTAPSMSMGDDDTLRAALFTLAPEDLPAPIYPYRHFLDAQGERAIQDD